MLTSKSRLRITQLANGTYYIMYKYTFRYASLELKSVIFICHVTLVVTICTNLKMSPIFTLIYLPNLSENISLEPCTYIRQETSTLRVGHNDFEMSSEKLEGKSSQTFHKHGLTRGQWMCSSVLQVDSLFYISSSALWNKWHDI